MIRDALTDRAFDAQAALTAIKSFAYGGVVDEREARQRAAELRRQAEQIATLLEADHGPDEKPFSR